MRTEMTERQRMCSGTMEKQSDGSWLCHRCGHRYVPPPKKNRPTRKELTRFSGELWEALVESLPYVLGVETEDHHALLDFQERLKCSPAMAEAMLEAASKRFQKLILTPPSPRNLTLGG